MSRADVPRAVVTLAVVVTLVTLVTLVSCMEGNEEAQFDAVAPSVDSIDIRFTCGTVDSLALRTMGGKPAWAIKRHKKDSITWIVPANVAINSIAGLPLDSAGPQGGGLGVPFRSKVKENASKDTFDYVIESTCHPASGPDRHLFIDPVMIVH